MQGLHRTFEPLSHGLMESWCAVKCHRQLAAQTWSSGAAPRSKHIVLLTDTPCRYQAPLYRDDVCICFETSWCTEGGAIWCIEGGDSWCIEGRTSTRIDRSPTCVSYLQSGITNLRGQYQLNTTGLYQDVALKP